MPREPEETEYVTISIRLPKELHADAVKIAAEEDRSLSAVGVRAFRAYVKEAQKKGGR